MPQASTAKSQLEFRRGEVRASIKRECLDKLAPLGERHLRFAISEFIEHYHLERNHQGLDNQLITTVAVSANENADPARRITRRERIGGLLSYYYRSAA